MNAMKQRRHGLFSQLGRVLRRIRTPLYTLPKEEAAGYCRRLAALLASGMPFPEALLYAAEGVRRLTRAAIRLKEAVLAGVPLSEALAREKFPRTAVQFCLLAERSGNYPRGLMLAAEALERGSARNRCARQHAVSCPDVRGASAPFCALFGVCLPRL